MASASLLCGQERPPASGSAEPLRRDYRFEVASIRAADPPAGIPSGRPQFTPGRFRDDHATIVGLAMQAFETRGRYDIEYQSWMRSPHFAINATLPEGATKADLPIMIQHLLEDRFGLVFHREMRKMDGYELVVAKSGPRLAHSTSTAPDPSTSKGLGILIKDGELQFAKDAGSGAITNGATSVWRGRNKTMASLATDLGYQFGAPVRDATGLQGEYDFTLTFTSEAYMRPRSDVSQPGSAPGPGVGEDEPPGHPLLRDALEKELGLKLQPARDVPVNVVVLDSAKKEPTEN